MSEQVQVVSDPLEDALAMGGALEPEPEPEDVKDESREMTEEFAETLPGGLKEALRDELLYRVQQDMALAETEQIMASRSADFRPLDYGEQKMQVHPFFYHYWGRRLGYECWSDDGFIDEFIRDNEAVRVRRVSERTRVPGWRPESVRYSRKFDL